MNEEVILKIALEMDAAHIKARKLHLKDGSREYHEGLADGLARALEIIREIRAERFDINKIFALCPDGEFKANKAEFTDD